MGSGRGWSRRRFLVVSGGAAAVGLKGLAQGPGAATTAPVPVRLPSEVISGGIQPLMVGHTARPLRYKPVGGEFGNSAMGSEFFNRPIYGPNNDFRVDAGDLPEFSLYLPGHGGNLKLGFSQELAGGAGDPPSEVGAQADEVVARYQPGRMIYVEIRDALLRQVHAAGGVVDRWRRLWVDGEG